MRSKLFVLCLAFTVLLVVFLTTTGCDQLRTPVGTPETVNPTVLQKIDTLAGKVDSIAANPATGIVSTAIPYGTIGTALAAFLTAGWLTLRAKIKEMADDLYNGIKPSSPAVSEPTPPIIVAAPAPAVSSD